MNNSTEVKNYFDMLASGWGNRYLDNSDVQSRLNIFSNELSINVKPESKVLDFGCGAGDITSYLSDAGYEMYGIDVSAEMIREANDRCSDGLINLQIYAGSGSLNYNDNQFDAVISSSVLEYVSNLEELLYELFRILKPGGTIIFTVPDMRHRHRFKELLLISLLKINFIKSILIKSKWSEGIHYLNFSKNRLTVKQWLKDIASIGFVPNAVPECNSALVMISAKKPN